MKWYVLHTFPTINSKKYLRCFSSFLPLQYMRAILPIFFLSKNDVSLHLPWDVHKIECSEWCGPIKIERFYVYGCLMTSKKAHTMKMERAFRLLFIVCPPEIRYKWKIPFRLKKGKIVNTTSNSVVMCCLLFL